MTERDKQRAVSNELEKHAPERFRSLLIPVDLTPISDRVLGRVALLPLSDGARITLLHVVPKSLPPGDRRTAERNAKKLLADEMKNLAKSVPKGVSITPVVKIGAAAKEIAICARSAKVDLIVMGRGGGSALRDVFLGSTAERVIRRLTLPVLVVRLAARAPYSRPAIALDFDHAAHDALALMLRVLPAPRLRVLVIHAFDPLYKGRVYMSLSEEAAEEWREQFQQTAARRLANLLATYLARAKVQPREMPMWKTHIQCGSPRKIIEKTVRKADTDLLVLGTRGFTGIMHLFLGTVAGDVLRDVACDVLVVPPRPRRK
jgi:nucleotide-binding universal stress UspA family protein